MYPLKKTISILVLSIILKSLSAQTIPLNNLCDLTGILQESSGITYIAPNRLYTHDDSGGNDEIYELDTLGNLIRTININSANNSDWEDITHDNLQNIYIGDFGNNNNDRTNLRVYKIPSPSSFSGNSITADVIEFNYPDQSMFPPNPTKRNYDVEGFVWFNDSLFLFTKNRTSPFNGYCKMYKIPAIPGIYTAQICDSIFLCGDAQSSCWVTSAALSPDNSHLALLNHNKIWWFSCFNGAAFFKGALATVNLNTNTQKEGITFKNNHEVFITDEFSAIDNSGGNLYETDLIDYLEMPYVNIIPDSIICDNCTLTVDSFIGVLSWSNGLIGPSITPSYTGWHTVTAKNLNNCSVIDSVYISYLQSALEYDMAELSVIISESNSTVINGKIKEASNDIYHLMLTDITGKLISAKTIEITQKNVDFNMYLNITSGLYFLQLNSKRANKTIKLIISE